MGCLLTVPDSPRPAALPAVLRSNAAFVDEVPVYRTPVFYTPFAAGHARAADARCNFLVVSSDGALVRLHGCGPDLQAARTRFAQLADSTHEYVELIRVPVSTSLGCVLGDDDPRDVRCTVLASSRNSQVSRKIYFFESRAAPLT